MIKKKGDEKKMKKLLAIYRPSRDQGIRGMIAEYNTKKNFKDQKKLEEFIKNYPVDIFEIK